MSLFVRKSGNSPLLHIIKDIGMEAELNGGNMIGTKLSSSDFFFVIDLTDKSVYIR